MLLLGRLKKVLSLVYIVKFVVLVLFPVNLLAFSCSLRSFFCRFDIFSLFSCSYGVIRPFELEFWREHIGDLFYVSYWPKSLFA